MKHQSFHLVRTTVGTKAIAFGLCLLLYVPILTLPASAEEVPEGSEEIQAGEWYPGEDCDSGSGMSTVPETVEETAAQPDSELGTIPGVMLPSEETVPEEDALPERRNGRFSFRLWNIPSRSGQRSPPLPGITV